MFAEHFYSKHIFLYIYMLHFCAAQQQTKDLFGLTTIVDLLMESYFCKFFHKFFFVFFSTDKFPQIALQNIFVNKSYKVYLCCFIF